MPVGRSAPPKYSRNWTMVAACASSRCSPLGYRDDLRGLGPSSPSRGELPLIEGPVTKDEVPLLARVALVEHTPGVGAGDSAREVAEDGCLAEVERPAGPALHRDGGHHPAYEVVAAPHAIARGQGARRLVAEDRLHDGNAPLGRGEGARSEEHTSELQSRSDIVCRLLLEKKKAPCPLRATSHNFPTSSKW